MKTTETAEVTWRRWTEDDVGGFDVQVGDVLVQFDFPPGPTHGVGASCQLCGAHVVDWQKPDHLRHVNLIRHATWHAAQPVL